MTPYYTDGERTIYHGDCREILPGLHVMTEDAVMITDPPYGINRSHESEWTHTGKHRRSGCDWSVTGDESTTVRDEVLGLWIDRSALVFASWKEPIVGAGFCLVWDKGLCTGMGDLSIPWKPNWELIFGFGRAFRGRRESGVIQSYQLPLKHGSHILHPTEKPVELMGMLIGKSLPRIVVDPFMGSGSTLVAAKEHSRMAVGIEIEERYCAIAAKRLSQEVFEFGEAKR